MSFEFPKNQLCGLFALVLEAGHGGMLTRLILSAPPPPPGVDTPMRIGWMHTRVHRLQGFLRP